MKLFKLFSCKFNYDFQTPVFAGHEPSKFQWTGDIKPE